MRLSTIALLVLVFAALSLFSETAASGLRAEPRDGATMPKADGEWRQYVVPAGEKDAGRMFYYNMQTKEKTWEKPAAMGGSSSGKWITTSTNR
jgi:hypothetical protein